MAQVIPRKIIRLSKSCVGEAEKNAVMDVLDREYLGMGAEVQEFEQALTDYFGRPAVCVVNGTAALQLALQAAGIGPGDEVLVQSLTYVASFQAIAATGATPVACDVDPDTLTLDWRDAERRVTDKTKAVMPVHYAGGVGMLDEIYEFANRHKLRVIEDAAHAFGTKYKGNVVGGFGDVACFSFDGIKNITSGEGGCIVSDNLDLVNKVRDARLLGVEKDTEKRYLGQRSWRFDVSSQGWRYHMSNIMAAIGVQQLKRSTQFFMKRKELANIYVDRLKKCRKLELLNLDYTEVVPHIFPVLLKSSGLREKLIEHFERMGVQTGIHYQPCHELSLFRSSNELALETTEKIAGNILTLPLHAELERSDVNYVTDVLLSCLKDE